MNRNGKKHYRLFIIFTLLVGLSGLFNASLLTAKDAEIRLTLKTGEVKNFDYKSFDFNWEFPITVFEQGTCEKFVLTKDAIDEIYFICDFWNECKKKEDYEFDIYLVDGKQILGYIEASNPDKTNTDSAKLSRIQSKMIRFSDAQTTKTDRSYRYWDIKKLSFHR